MRTVQVNLENQSYPIHIGHQLLDHFPELFRAEIAVGQHAVLIFDEAVRPCAEAVAESLTKEQVRASLVPIPCGEASKCISQLDKVWQAMLAERTDRGSTVVAIGGGVVGDLAGFAAASFARGIRLVQVPTTLLSQVDSSVGGKTGINLPLAKNIVGAFWQPELVVIDNTTLNTLPEREFTSGLAEVAKYGVILLPELFEYLESHYRQILARDPEAITHIVAESCRAKAMVVQEDERETSGRRAILNYGHTFGHAIESVSGYGKFLHGEAVALGMQMAAHLARRLGLLSSDFVERQQELLNRLNLPTREVFARPHLLWQAMQHDKKVIHGRLKFVLPRRIGHVELVGDVAEKEVLAAIEDAQADPASAK